MKSALYAALVVVVWALVAWPTLDLPWGTCDDPHTFAIAGRIERAAPLERPFMSGEAGNASYPGRFMPVFWMWLWGWWKLLGPGVLAHRALHLVTFLWLGLWVRSAVARASGHEGIAGLAAAGYLIFAGQYEAWLALQPIEPVQALCAAGFVECCARLTGRGELSWRWGSAGAAALLTCLAFKETSLCLGLPLALATALRVAGSRSARGHGPLWIAWAVYLGYLAVFWAKRPEMAAQGGPGTWVGNYQPTLANCLATLSLIVAQLWKGSGPVVALGLAGLCLTGRRDEKAGETPALAALVAAWALGGLIIYLPWSQFAPRHMLWIAVPLAAAVGIGVARLRQARRAVALPALALAAGSLFWMSAQYAVTMSTLLARYRLGDGTFWQMAEAVVAHAPARARLVEPPGEVTLTLFEIFIPAVLGRSDLTFGKLEAEEAVRPGEMVLVSGYRLQPPRPALEPVAIVTGEMVERDLPEPRYASWLARQLVMGRRPPAVPVVDFLAPPLFTRKAGYALYRAPAPTRPERFRAP